MAEKAMLENLLSRAKEEYEKELDDAQRTGGVVGNRYPWQTRMVVQRLLANARTEQLAICILSGGISQEFYGDWLIDNLRECLEAGCEVRVAIWHDDRSVVGPALVDIAGRYAQKMQLRWSGTRGVIAEQLCHFMLVGDRTYRQEAPHHDFKDERFTEFSPEVVARVAFNDEAQTRAQKELFEIVWSVCGPFTQAA